MRGRIPGRIFGGGSAGAAWYLHRNLPASITSVTSTDGATVGYPMVTLRVVGENLAELRFQNAGESWGDWQAVGGEYYRHTLIPGDGAKTVYVQARNTLGTTAGTDNVAVTLDSWAMTLQLLNNLPATWSQANSGVLYDLVSAVATWIEHWRASLAKAVDQLDALSARGQWLAVWGALLGVARRATETEPEYAARLLGDVLRARSTRRSVRDAVAEECSGSVLVVSPASYPGYLIVDLTGAGHYDLAAVRRRLRDFVAAGVKAVLVTA